MIQLSLTYGQALKADGQDLVASYNTEFVALMRAEAIRISNERGFVTSDDLRVYASRIGIAPTHPNCWGAVWRGKGWSRVGYRKSAVPQAHARTIAIWKYGAHHGTEGNG